MKAFQAGHVERPIVHLARNVCKRQSALQKTIYDVLCKNIASYSFMARFIDLDQ